MEKFKNAMRTFGRQFVAGVRARWWYFLIIAGVIGLDQLTKWITVKNLELLESYPLWDGVFHFTRWHNKGAAFGMLSDARWVFMVISTIGILAFLMYLFAKRERDLLLDIGVTFIIGGGIGNMIDRTALGYVVDFLDFRLIDFAIFNVADSFVCIGGGMLILALILQIIREEKKKKQDAGTGGDVPPEDNP